LNRNGDLSNLLGHKFADNEWKKYFEDRNKPYSAFCFVLEDNMQANDPVVKAKIAMIREAAQHSSGRLQIYLIQQ
jgi:hypothetical protein